MVPYICTMKDLLKYTTIATIYDEYKLVANFYLDEVIPFAVYLEGSSYYADNEDWIFVTFYQFIQRYLNRTMTESDTIEFMEELAFLNEDLAKDLKDIIEEGIKLGWNV